MYQHRPQTAKSARIVVVVVGGCRFSPCLRKQRKQHDGSGTTERPQDDDGKSTTGDRLAAAASEHLKKDKKKKKARKDCDKRRRGEHPDRARQRGLTLCFALVGWRFPTRSHRKLARVQLLSRIGPFDCAWGRGFAHAPCHGVMSTCCHAAIWTPAKGQQGDNRRTRR